MSLVLLIASGCAPRTDWIESTLVTADVTGRWAGTWDTPEIAAGFDMTLQQTGPKATGDVRVTMSHMFDGPIVGTVSGDVLRFSRPDGQLRGEVIVAGDVMTGTATFGRHGTRTLRLQRQPGGQPESR